MQQRVGVVMGGMSADRHVSLQTGKAVADALESLGCDVVRIIFGPGERSADVLLREANIDVAFLVLQGPGGEDGCIQGMLEWMGIPYTGSSVLAAALATDKLKAKELFRLHNVPTPPYYVINENSVDEVPTVHGTFGFPVVVKARGHGSSVAFARNLSELERAIRNELSYTSQVLVERFVEGREIHVGVLDGRVLGAVEVAPKSVPSGGLMCVPNTAGAIVPPQIGHARSLGVVNLALRAVAALECSGACRVDLMVTEGENEYVLEVNTLPGLTPTSLLPKIAELAGMSYPALCEAVLAGAQLGKLRPARSSKIVTADVPLVPADIAAVG